MNVASGFTQSSVSRTRFQPHYFFPAINRWAILIRPLAWTQNTFWAKPYRLRKQVGQRDLNPSAYAMVLTSLPPARHSSCDSSTRDLDHHPHLCSLLAFVLYSSTSQCRKKGLNTWQPFLSPSRTATALVPKSWKPRFTF